MRKGIVWHLLLPDTKELLIIATALLIIFMGMTIHRKNLIIDRMHAEAFEDAADEAKWRIAYIASRNGESEALTLLWSTLRAWEECDEVKF